MGTTGRTWGALLLLGFFLISVFSQPVQEAQPLPEETGGKCRENRKIVLKENLPTTHEEILLSCTECTPLRENLEKAFNECNGNALDFSSLSRQANGKGKGGKGKSGKGKGKGKGGKGKGGKGKGGKGKGGKGKGKGGRACPSVDDVMEKLRSKSQKDSCVFKSLGWINEGGKPITEVITAEISVLPAEVASQLSKDDVETCALEKAREWSNRPKRLRCDATYSQDDRAALHEYELTVAGMKCMKTVMRTSCSDFVNKPQAVAEPIPFPIAPNPHLPGQLLPEKWPSNLVAALVPADWAAENFQFQFGATDEYDYYEYYYNYDDEYTGDYADYYDEYYDDTTVVDEPISGGGIAVNIPFDLTDGNTEDDSSAETEAP